MVVQLLDMTNVLHLLESLMIIQIMAVAGNVHRCAHTARHFSISVDSAVEMQVLHQHPDVSIGQVYQ